MSSPQLVIRDPAFEAALLREFGKPPNGELSLEEVGDRQTLQINDASVRDVAGLEHFTGLWKLDLSGTGISDLTPLAALSELDALYLADTKVTDISVLSNLSNLYGLDLSGTAVTDISPLAKLDQLGVLNLADTSVTDTTVLDGLPGPIEVTLPTVEEDTRAYAAALLSERADAHASAQKWRDAAELYTASAVIYRDLTRESFSEYGSMLANALGSLADVWVDLGNRDEAIEAYDEAAATLRRLEKMHRGQYAEALAHTLMFQGEALWMSANWSASAKCYEEGFGIFQRLVETDPSFTYPSLASERLKYWGAVRMAQSSSP